MANYHESGTICEATKRACPLGAHEHITANSQEEFEAKLSEKYDEGPLQKTSSNSKPQLSAKEKRASLHKPQLTSRLPAKATLEDIKNAIAYAKVNGVPTGITYKAEDIPPINANKYRDEDGDFATPYVAQSSSLIANPDGSLTVVNTSAWIQSEKDGYSWEHHPDVESKYKVFKSLADFREFQKTGKADVITGRHEIDPNKVFNSGSNQYSKFDLNSAVQAAKRAQAQEIDSASVAKVAFLKTNEKKMTVAQLMSADYGGSKDPLVRAAVASRKELPKSAFPKLLESGDSKVLIELSKRPDLDRATEDAIYNHEETSSYHGSPKATLLKNPKTSAAIINKAAREGNRVIIRMIALHPNLSERARQTMIKRAAKENVRLPF